MLGTQLNSSFNHYLHDLFIRLSQNPVRYKNTFALMSSTKRQEFKELVYKTTIKSLDLTI